MEKEADKKCKMVNSSDPIPAVVHVPSEISEQRDLAQDAKEDLNKVLLEHEEIIRQRKETIRQLQKKNGMFLHFINDKILKTNTSV